MDSNLKARYTKCTKCPAGRVCPLVQDRSYRKTWIRANPDYKDAETTPTVSKILSDVYKVYNWDQTNYPPTKD